LSLGAVLGSVVMHGGAGFSRMWFRTRGVLGLHLGG
jgi:hypothetical protein